MKTKSRHNFYLVPHEIREEHRQPHLFQKLFDHLEGQLLIGELQKPCTARMVIILFQISKVFLFDSEEHIW